MTDVRAGTHQRSVATGELGIVTLWVRAESQPAALARAKSILTNKRYASIGRLSSYAEALDHDPLAYVTEQDLVAERREDFLLAGYDAMKEQALAEAEGLHEVWLGVPEHQVVPQRRIA